MKRMKHKQLQINIVRLDVTSEETKHSSTCLYRHQPF